MTSSPTAVNTAGNHADIRVGVESIRLTDDGLVVIADNSGYRLWRAEVSWLQQVWEPLAPSERGLAETSTPERTSQLLAGCLHAAIREVKQQDCPAQKQPTDPSLRLLQYLYWLCGSYQTTHATPRLLWQVRERFLTLGDTAATCLVEQKIKEETGHDRLAFLDIAALGYDAAALTAAVQPKDSVALVQYYEQPTETDCPYGIFGYAYAVERLALFRNQKDIDAIQALVSPGLDITRCLRVHSAVGSDCDHVAELAAFIAGLSRDHRQTVLEATYQTAKLISAPQNADFDVASFKAQLARAALV